MIALPGMALAGGMSNGGCCGFGGGSASALKKTTQSTPSGGTLYVKQTDEAYANAYVRRNRSGATGSGDSKTYIDTAPGVTATSQKMSVQQGGAYADNSQAAGYGASYTLLKVQASDGSYFLYKGSATAGAAVGPGGTASGGSASSASRTGKN